MKKLVIFETNNKDGIMSRSKKFYPDTYSEEDIKQDFLKVRQKVGEKYGFSGLKILQPAQKDVETNLDYPDGTYKRIDGTCLLKEDLWYETIPADILVIDSNYQNIVIGHRAADCPVIIAEDRKKQVVAVSHSGALQINRKVPMYTISALQKEAGSNLNDIYVYIGSCIKKSSYVYDRYPNWATNASVWENCIEKKDNLYHIDLVTAIINQLNIPKEHITISPVDTYKNPDYYSHLSEVKKESKPIGQNFIGAFYKEQR